MIGEKSEEFRGKTVEAAISAGLAALRLTREQVEIEIVRPGSRGVLGIGAEDAVVRLTAIRPGKPEPKAPSRPAPQPPAEPEPAPATNPSPAPARTEPRPTPTPPPPSAAVTAIAAEDKAAAAALKGKELLSEVLARMNLQAEVEVVPQSDAEADEDEPTLVLNIVGDDLGMLIGRQNETLSALEFVTRLMVNQQTHTRTSFVVDVNGYRAKRAESLRRLALRMAEQVEQAGRTMPLEPMTPAERRIIHLALRNHPTVMTQSVGEGDRRKVTIVPKKG